MSFYQLVLSLFILFLPFDFSLAKSELCKNPIEFDLIIFIENLADLDESYFLILKNKYIYKVNSKGKLLAERSISQWGFKSTDEITGWFLVFHTVLVDDNHLIAITNDTRYYFVNLRLEKVVGPKEATGFYPNDWTSYPRFL